MSPVVFMFVVSHNERGYWRGEQDDDDDVSAIFISFRKVREKDRDLN